MRQLAHDELTRISGGTSFFQTISDWFSSWGGNPEEPDRWIYEEMDYNYRHYGEGRQ